MEKVENLDLDYEKSMLRAFARSRAKNIGNLRRRTKSRGAILSSARDLVQEKLQKKP